MKTEAKFREIIVILLKAAPHRDSGSDRFYGF